MSEQNNKIIDTPEKEKIEIQQVLQEIPSDVLIGAIADRIQPEPNKDANRNITQAVSQKKFAEPIPPPSMLGEYDDIHRGLADRIVSMAETQQNHRQLLEKQSVEAAIKTEGRGQHYAFVLSLLIIVGALYLIDSGKEVSGSILAGGTLTGLAYLFITGRKKEKQSPSEPKKPS